MTVPRLRRFPSDRYDIIGALICLLGVAVIMYAPRAGQGFPIHQRRSTKRSSVHVTAA